MSDADEKPPFLRLAADNSQKDIDRERATGFVEWRLRDLAANLIRVVRGAGKPEDIGPQCWSVIEAFDEYRKVDGIWPSGEIARQALSIRNAVEDETRGAEWLREHARNTMIRGALQVTASRLVGQLTQEQRGRSELMQGFNDLEEIRAEARKRRLAEERAEREASRPKRPTRPKAKKKPRTASRKKDTPEAN